MLVRTSITIPNIVCAILAAALWRATSENPDHIPLVPGAIATTGILVAIFSHAALSGRIRFATVLASISLPVSILAENTGMRTSILFGSTYEYHEALDSLSVFGVPFFVPAAWFALCYFAAITYVLDRPEVGSSRRVRCVLAAILVSAQDLYLEPAGVGSSLWTWHEPGPYYGAPLLNFFGWFTTALAILFATTHVASRLRESTQQPSERLDTLYIWCSVMLATTITLLHAVSRQDPALPLVFALTTILPVWWAERLRGLFGIRCALSTQETI